MPHSVRVMPQGEVAFADGNETLLDALNRSDIDYPHGCTAGVCGLCKSRLVSGKVEFTQYYSSALSDEEKKAGLILVCCAVPLSDCAVSPVQPDVILPSVRTTSAEIHRVEDLTHDIRLVSIRPVDSQPLRFLAGQYISLSTDTLPGREFSMANMPGNAELEFFIRRVPKGVFTEFIFESATVGQPVTVTGPYGMAFLRESHTGPLLAVAGGSGLAPMRSIISTALNHGMKQPIRLFVGVRTERDVYMESELRDLEARHPNFRATFVLSEATGSTKRPTGFLHEVLAAEMAQEDLSDTLAYLAGPPIMVTEVSKALAKLGLPDSHCHADPFLTSADKIGKVTACG